MHFLYKDIRVSVCFFTLVYPRAFVHEFSTGAIECDLVASVLPTEISAIVAIIAQYIEGDRASSSLRKKLLRLSGWGTLYRRAPGRVKCPNFPLAETDWFPLPETDLGPDLTTPDESEGDTMRIRKLRSSSTTSEQQLSTSHSHPPSILHFCAPRGRRHPDTPGHQNENYTPEPNEQTRVRVRLVSDPPCTERISEQEQAPGPRANCPQGSN